MKQVSYEYYAGSAGVGIGKDPGVERSHGVCSCGATERSSR